MDINQRVQRQDEIVKDMDMCEQTDKYGIGSDMDIYGQTNKYSPNSIAGEITEKSQKKHTFGTLKSSNQWPLH